MTTITLSPVQRLLVALEEYETVLRSLTVGEFDDLDERLPDSELRYPLLLKYDLERMDDIPF